MIDDLTPQGLTMDPVMNASMVAPELPSDPLPEWGGSSHPGYPTKVETNTTEPEAPQYTEKNTEKTSLYQIFQREDVLPPMEHWKFWSPVILAGTILTGIVLAIALQINIKVRAPGEIRPDRDTQVLQADIDGTVASIDVAENQAVTAGQPILQIHAPSMAPLQAQTEAQAEILHQLMMEQEALRSQQSSIESNILAAADLTVVERSPERYQTIVNTALTNLATINPQQASWFSSQYQQNQMELNQLAQAIDRQQRVTDALQQQLDQQRLVAPTDGTILRLHTHTLGSHVRQGMPLVDLMPATTRLQVEADVAVADIGAVKVGQTAQMQISAYPYPDYGILTGEVTAIAPDAALCDRPRCPHPNTYQVIVQLDADHLQRGDEIYPLQPGMEVTVDIISRRERLFNLLLQRLRLQTDW